MSIAALLEDEEGLLAALSALASPHRLQIVALLSEGRQYVSQLSREMELSRPLLHMHLQRLERAGLVRGTLELSPDGKAMRYYEVVSFSIELTPESVRRAVRSGGSRERPAP
jgi:predicted transcriptional regulator